MTTRSRNKIQKFEFPDLNRFPAHFNAAAKRALDMCASALRLLLTSFFLMITIKLKREEPGPVFYRGPRVGKEGKEFGILKFRSMYEHPESYRGARITAWDDERITPTGRWLRDTKLNELPQLWNLLVGEMSLVGPRPEDPEFVKEWPTELRREILSSCMRLIHGQIRFPKQYNGKMNQCRIYVNL